MLNPTQAKRLVALCRGKSPWLILSHNHPDPDSLACAWALQFILAEKAQVASKIVYGGIMGREENRLMNNLLKIGAIRLRLSHFLKYKFVALMDTQPGAGNNSLPPEIKPLVVIDHHPPLPASLEVEFRYIENDCGATATIMVELIQALGVEPPPLLSTALYYSLISETQHLGRDVTQRDIDAAIFLFPRAKHRLISQIQHPHRNREFFQQLYIALEKAFTYKSVVAATLGTIHHPGFVAQLADILISLQRSAWCFVSGRYRDTLYLSLRTTRPKARAGRLLRAVIGKLGSAGGHDMMAGGQIPLKNMSPEEIKTLEDKLLRQFFKEVGMPEDYNPTPLVNLSPPA